MNAGDRKRAMLGEHCVRAIECACHVRAAIHRNAGGFDERVGELGTRHF